MSKGSRVTKLHKVEANEVLEDLKAQLEAAKKARVDKLQMSEAHLIKQLEMAAEKYLTVNGYMQVRTTMLQVPLGLKEAEPENGFNTLATGIAFEMSELAADMAAKLTALDVMGLDESFLDGYLEKNFVTTRVDPLLADVVRQLLIVNLLQNVGPVVDEIIGFRVSTDEAIAVIETTIAENSV
jgi:hypothetical protein